VNDAQYFMVKKRVRDLLQIDLDAYKPQQMRRRIDRFVQRRAGDDVAVYCRALEHDGQALDDLRSMLTINVSEFVRDPAQFERLQEELLPPMLARRDRLRVWSAACSHGAEAYTLAMILDELSAPAARVLGTDIDRRMIERARAGGPYAPHELRNLSPSRLRRFFEVTPEGIFVRAALRQRVHFAEHDLLGEPPEGEYDLIACRNVLIYFTAETKRALCGRLRAALRDDGVLFVGGTEGLLGPESAGFQRIGGNFYRRTAAAGLARSA
jgi:chemotaxis protein methyltransferase CheR